jgi:hypothetical protein
MVVILFEVLHGWLLELLLLLLHGLLRLSASQLLQDLHHFFVDGQAVVRWLVLLNIAADAHDVFVALHFFLSLNTLETDGVAALWE